ncbi:DUF6578 domain-containing protein [Kineococcus esterisolvens]|uniref:DUF6578 domain-containing protein n=1 Tax=unclassified Kineococcus TaxID=2621656 RepID=UPI003D7DD0EF
MDVVVEVGGWEHECCGPSIERDEVVDFACVLLPGSSTGSTAPPRLIETHHDLDTFQPTHRIRGRVVDIEVVHDDGSARPILRVPSGAALCGYGEDDDHLEDPWTGETVTSPARNDFLVTVREPGWRLLDPSSIYRT